MLQTISGELVHRGYDIQILTLEKAETAYAMPPQVRVASLWTHFLNRGFLKILASPLIALELHIRLATIKPQAWMSLLGRSNFAACLTRIWGYPGPIVVSEHVHLTEWYSSATARGRIMQYLVRRLYSLADKVLAVSDGVAEALRDIGVSSEKISVIYNAIDVQFFQNEANKAGIHASSSGPTIASIGRLSYQKDHETLLLAFKLVKEKIENARLVIVGDGPERASLEKIRTQLNLSHSVDFAGWQKNPYAYIRGATCFVLSSRFEGFGLVLIEAMASGLPVISTDCPSGPAEILGNQKYGLLVEVGNVQMLAETMLVLLKDETVHAKFKALGAKRCWDFDVKATCDQYLEFLEILPPSGSP